MRWSEVESFHVGVACRCGMSWQWSAFGSFEILLRRRLHR